MGRLGPHAGFTTGTPWIAGQPQPRRDQRARPRAADPDSVFHHYRRLIELRHTEPVVAHGDFTMLLPDDEQVYAFTRRLGDVELLVLANFSGDTVHPEVPDAAAWAGAELLLGNCRAADGLRRVPALRPWEARVHRRGG